MSHSNSMFLSINQELQQLNNNLQSMIKAEHPILYAAAEQLFSAGGKRIRPIIILIVANLTKRSSKISKEQRRLAEITEIIHTASLVHDDIIDNCDTRRGIASVHNVFNNKIAVLAGDFLFAQSSWYLANLNNLDVVKTISKVITDFAEGEVQQGTKSFDNYISIEDYTEKSFYKTASLIACSCKATTMIELYDKPVQDDFYLYGKHLGLAFQIIDDILDVISSTDKLGKPSGLDLQNGNLTAPVIFALEEKPELNQMINQEFQNKQDINKAIRLIKQTKGIQKAKDLAEEHIQLAIHIIKSKYSNQDIKDLLLVSYFILERIN
uniref:Prenyl transferase n=1 Tax=Alsidium seaforthii TaxID=2007182 RepID=A0A1Z1MCZ1_9FLOR|nr:prenyl transferase [Bryothamnion seaforthii]ARW63957.1 prenyl transferase [Bryothamnion seaforthii]